MNLWFSSNNQRGHLKWKKKKQTEVIIPIHPAIIAVKQFRGKEQHLNFTPGRFEAETLVAVSCILVKSCLPVSASLVARPFLSPHVSATKHDFVLAAFVLQAFDIFLATLRLSCINLSREILACHDAGIYFVERLTSPPPRKLRVQLPFSKVRYISILCFRVRSQKSCLNISANIYRYWLHHSPFSFLFLLTLLTICFLSSSTTTAASEFRSLWNKLQFEPVAFGGKGKLVLILDR